jgi:uncharacterized BrkB/YihY/UPF0761 family membrane protein
VELALSWIAVVCGSLATIVILLTWLYLSSYLIVFGDELKSELEHQTWRDTTKGSEQPWAVAALGPPTTLPEVRQ